LKENATGAYLTTVRIVCAVDVCRQNFPRSGIGDVRLVSVGILIGLIGVVSRLVGIVCRCGFIHRRIPRAPLIERWQGLHESRHDRIVGLSVSCHGLRTTSRLFIGRILFFPEKPETHDAANDGLVGIGLMNAISQDCRDLYSLGVVRMKTARPVHGVFIKHLKGFGGFGSLCLDLRGNY
jgi:hypothetical protein